MGGARVEKYTGTIIRNKEPEYGTVPRTGKCVESTQMLNCHPKGFDDVLGCSRW